MDIEITFQNESNDANNSQVVIFESVSTGPLPGAPEPLHVLPDLAPGASHTLTVARPMGPRPVLRVAVVPAAGPDAPIDFETAARSATELSLRGVTHATVVVTGSQAAGYGFQLRDQQT